MAGKPIALCENNNNNNDNNNDNNNVNNNLIYDIFKTRRHGRVISS
jgi:hypothetical protein